MKIIAVAPSRTIPPAVAERAQALAAAHGITLDIHPQCFLSDGHFAGSDAARAAALIEAANDPAYAAIWFARGGYGACRIVDSLDRLNHHASQKTYYGYSDTAFLLAPLYKHGIGRQVHAPMLADITRTNGEAALARVLEFMRGDLRGVEAGIDPQQPTIAFNITVLAALIGTPYLPDLTRHILLLEDIDEYTYRTDRALFQIMHGLRAQKPAGIRLGRVSAVPENTIPFGQDAETITQHWCETFGISYLGRADIGHDADNKLVPFGIAGSIS